MSGWRVNVLKFVWFALRLAQIFLWVAKMTSFSKGLKRMLMLDDAYASYLHTTIAARFLLFHLSALLVFAVCTLL